MGRTDRRDCPRVPIRILAHEDAHEPRLDGGTAPDGPQAMPSRVQGFADLYFGQGLASGHQGGGAKKHVLVLVHQVAKRLRVAVPAALKRLCLGHLPPRAQGRVKRWHR